MESIGDAYLVIGAGICMVIISGLIFLMWCLADISAECDDCEGVRDGQ
jgi:hypothetical protein